jgi:hypothetical protein
MPKSIAHVSGLRLEVGAAPAGSAWVLVSVMNGHCAAAMAAATVNGLDA